jgi:hemin uptake protein HemP
MKEQSPNDQARTNAMQTGVREPLLHVDSSMLFKGAQEIIIDHMGQEYRLRLTSQGKLLLTK